MGSHSIPVLVDHLFRHESGKMVAVLTRLLGFEHLETAQDIVQDTLLQAMNTWSFKGVPENPPAWLYKVARNKAIDLLRREKKFREISTVYAGMLQSEYSLPPTVSQLFLDPEISDSQLRMIFACCHPAISEESQIALTLKTLCGLDTVEIARAFLTTEDTIAKRIYRAREKIRAEKIQLEVPQGPELLPRLDNVLKSIYLLFNEGYNSQAEQLIREDLCYEAMRLCYMLTRHPVTNLGRTQALLSLICFQTSRMGSRLDKHGNIVLLKNQDRKLWDKDLIRKGVEYIRLATEGEEVSSYHLEAAIGSLHAIAPSFEETDWASIYDLYESLYRIKPTPIVALNKAIASGYAIDKKAALKALQEIEGLDHYYLYHASVGDHFLATGNHAAARIAFEKARELTPSGTEKQLLSEKIIRCQD